MSNDTNSSILKRPTLRNRDGVVSPYTSLLEISATVDATATGVVETAGITIPDNLIIGQLPGASIKAHLCIRNLVITMSANGTVTSYTAYVDYKDVQSREHIIAGVNALGIVNIYDLLLIVDAPITDARPNNLGTFLLDVTQLTFGTATKITLDIRANIEIHYEQ